MVSTTLEPASSQKYGEKNPIRRRRKLPPLNFGGYALSKHRLPLAYLVRS